MNLARRLFWTFLIWWNYGLRYLSRKNILVTSAGRVAERLSSVQATLQPLGSPHLNLTRVGSQLDGGYYLAEGWQRVEALFSPGVGGQISFDEEFARQGIPVFLLDPNPFDQEFFSTGMHFQKGFLAGETGGDRLTLLDWISQSNVKGENLALQMDIEGGEYEVLERYLSDVGNFSRFQFIAIELHDLFEQAADDLKYASLTSCLDALLESHVPIAVLPSCFDKPVRTTKGDFFQTLEVTFHRREPVSQYSSPGFAPKHKGFRLLPARSFSTAAKQ